MSVDKQVTWDDEDINNFCQKAMQYYKDEDTAYIILIGGKRYATPAGKSVWRKKNHASSAMNNHMNVWARKLATEKLIKEFNLVTASTTRWNKTYTLPDGTPFHFYKHDIYENAYKSMLQLRIKEYINLLNLKP